MSEKQDERPSQIETVRCLSCGTAYAKPSSGGTVRARRARKGSVSSAGGRLYVGSYDHNLYALRAGSGQPNRVISGSCAYMPGAYSR